MQDSWSTASAHFQVIDIIIVIFTDPVYTPGLGSKQMSVTVWPLTHSGTFHHVITLSSFFLFRWWLRYILGRNLNKWQTKILLWELEIPITATFKSVYPRGQMDCFSSETAETPLRDFRDMGLTRMRHTNGGTILTQNPQKQKNFNRIFQILLWKLRPWLWAPQTKFHSSPL